MSNEKNKRGGARPGAGRPAGSVTGKPGRKQVQISMQPEEFEKIKELAELQGKNVSRFLIDCALNFQ